MKYQVLIFNHVGRLESSLVCDSFGEARLVAVVIAESQEWICLDPISWGYYTDNTKTDPIIRLELGRY